MATLPQFAFVEDENNGKVYYVHRGEPTFHPVATDRTADELNHDAGVTPAQASAMRAGILYGWNSPAADPDLYAENGERRAVN
jgi:hypothetical protein